MINNLLNTWLHPTRLFYACIGFAVACLISYFGPKAYLLYVDSTHYISVPNLVTFDRKIYSAGETQIAKLTLKIETDSNVTLKSRLMLILMDNQYRIIKQSQGDGFVVAKGEPQTFVVPAPLPCDLPEGQYFYRAELQYEVKGVQKFTGFDTDIFTINNQRASDSAQIAQNCNTSPEALTN